MTVFAAEASIGPYRTIRQLGAGGMGEVFLAHDDELGRDIAIKMLPLHLAGDDDHLARLRQEARAASSLNHANIVTIYEIGEHDGSAFIAMEYIDGMTLRELLRNGPLPVRKALQLAAQIADGLAAAHKRGLVHRDLKPENVMVTSAGTVKILDFGLAKTLGLGGGHSQRASEPGTIAGTFAYMSPEQARAADVDYRSDQFSLGAIVYEMLTGLPAFDGASGVETLFRVVRDEPTPLSIAAPLVPAPMRWIVDRCLSKEADERYTSTRDLARDLQYLRDHFSETGIITPIRDEIDAGEIAPPVQRKSRIALVAILVLGLAIGGAIAAWLRKPAPRTITSERYLTYSGSDFSPATSPDGKLIAFSSRRDGTQRIWIKQVTGGSEVALTAGSDDFPRFSPDGASILYTHFPGDGANPALWRVPVVGGEARRIIDHSVTGDFSPDGARIAFTRFLVDARGHSSTAMYLANADGSAIRELAKIDIPTLVHPRWSPDQKWIAAVGARGRVAQNVILVDTSTGATKLLASPAKSGEVSSALWSKDGKSLIYTRAESVETVVGSTALIMKHDIATDRAVPVGWSSHCSSVLDVLGDGKIVFDVRSPRDNLRELSFGTGVGVTTATANAERWLTRGNSSDREPVYSPDGKSLLFASNRSGNLDLWLLDLDGGAVRKLTDDAAEDWDPAFTPDGKHVVWSSGRSGNLEIWIANADGSEARQVSHDGVDAENPAPTRDGQWIVYNSFDPAKHGVWRVRPDGSDAAPIVTGLAAIPDVSPDGQLVAYIADSRTARAAVRVARIADGKDSGFSIPLKTVQRTTAIIGRMRWTADGKSIAYIGQDANGVNGIYIQDFIPGRDTSTTRRTLGGFDREYATESFAISPDGRSITVAGWEQLFSVFSIDGLPEVSAKRADKKEN